ncbi:ricin-type beta-trefoil lectin domain protein [Streptomonospora alba]|uniref:Ricin-type beta-trefoil lectin domain protein n=1 Tax=Streptomonospora alba TaxID=183763 RepID=A0A0C2FJ31_9ACTN|nr:ricin-type beta-trefoil lectin domain protein [Streptomonospora alba]
MAAAATVCLLAASAAGPAQAEPASTATVTPDPSYQGQEFEGWGTSLAWFANATGDYPEPIRRELARLVFGDDGLDLNIARYNIGGGNAPDVPDYLRAGGAVEGWWKAPEGTARQDTDWWSAQDSDDWDPRADATQRWWVETVKDDVDHWEAFSNSPPWFMTESGYVSGGFEATEDQLAAGSVDDFAAYLVGATERLERAHGIEVDTLEPFNEPNTDYWSTTLGPDGDPVGGRQEGAHMGPELQQDVIRALEGRLSGAETGAVVAAMDETNPETFARNWLSYPEDVREKVAQLNVHTYGTGGRTAVRDLAKAAKRPLWMSETGGDWGEGQRWGGGGQDFETMSTGLGLAGHMVDDLRELEPSAWVFWQPVEDYDNMAPGGESDSGGNWGSIQIPFSCTAEDTLQTCPVRTNTKFDTARNFTHYIRPGDRLIGVDDASSAAAAAQSGDAATVVHVNDTAGPREVTVDLSKFARVAPDATVTPVVTDSGGALVEHEAVPVQEGAASVTVPAESVTTLVVDGVFGVAADAALVQPGRDYRLSGVQSGKALTAEGGSVVIDATEPGDAAQLWDIAEVTRGHDNRQRYVLTNRDRRLAVRGDSLVLEPARGRAGAVAQWIMSTTGDGSWTLVNRATGALIDVAGQATRDGAPVSVWRPTSGDNQRWRITAADGG